MTTAIAEVQELTIAHGQKTAFELRQQDKGWGRVFCHYIPLYPIYYALTRRTITPILMHLGGAVGLAFTLGFVLAAAEPNIKDKTLEDLGRAINFLTMAPLVKVGMERARKHGEIKLASHDA